MHVLQSVYSFYYVFWNYISGITKVSFVLGGSVVDDSKRVKDALRLADERMYEDKERYYREHPDKKYETIMSRRG